MTTYTIRFYSCHVESDSPVILYPMVVSSTNNGDRIWNGRENNGTEWRCAEGATRIVDLSLNTNNSVKTNTPYHLAADVVGGHSPALNSDIFYFDPNSTNIAYVTWSGNAISEGGTLTSVGTYTGSIVESAKSAVKHVAQAAGLTA